jgi:hypothetical protein
MRCLKHKTPFLWEKMIINSQGKLLNFRNFECVEFETFCTTKIYKYVSDSIF